jgi:sigma-B regulation protein RsbU (phosphoserine phosphatase)
MSRTASRVRFRTREELLDFLLEVAGLASETLDLDSLLEAVASMIGRAIPNDVFAILLYSERTKTLRIRYAKGHREEVVKNLELRLGEGIVGQAALTRKPVRVDDVRRDPRYLNSLDPVRSELAVPMSVGNRLVGVIDVESTTAGTFTLEDQALMTLIASRVAFSIDNARLYRRIQKSNRTLRTLASLAQEFSSILDLDQLLNRISLAMRILIDFDAFSILLVEDDYLRHRFSQRYDRRVEADLIRLGQGITGHVALTKEPLLVRDTLDDSRYIPTHPDIRSELAVPLIVKDNVIGVVDLESERIGYFTEDHLRTVSLLAPSLAIAIENARLYEEVETRRREMEEDLLAARQLQRMLLPATAPQLRGLDVAIVSRAAREVSGDIYDFFEHDNDYVMVVFGDSSGKGVAAALYGAMVSGLLRTHGNVRRGPARMMREVNSALVERSTASQYATLLSMVWRPSERTFTIANAGAVPPIIIRRGTLYQPKIEGVPIGLLAEREYDETVTSLERGDAFVLFSDGFQDQPDIRGVTYGDGRLHQMLMKVATRPAAEICDAVLADLERHRGSEPIQDDQTLLVMKVL